MMQPTSITCAQTAFLVEVEPDFRDASPAPFVVHLSALENDGNLLRPLVNPDGDRVVLHGRTEPQALRHALRYLASHFGDPGPREVWHPNHLQWGQPLVVEG